MAFQLSTPLSTSSGSVFEQPAGPSLSESFNWVPLVGLDCSEERAGAHERVTTMTHFGKADGDEADVLRTYSDTASAPVIAMLYKMRAVPAKLDREHSHGRRLLKNPGIKTTAGGGQDTHGDSSSCATSNKGNAGASPFLL